MIPSGSTVDQRIRRDLDRVIEQLSLGVSSDHVDKLLAFVALLGRWNGAYNLTAIRDPVSMVTHHLADCLAVVEPLRRRIKAVAKPRVLDVGSGAGLPGVLLAVLNPQWSVTCVDKVGKKVAFMRQCASELGLRNLRPEHARVEQLEVGKFDVITARAFGSLALLTELTSPLLKVDGAWMAMKGHVPQIEIDALPINGHVFHVEQLQVPGLSAERCLVWIDKPPCRDKVY